MIFSLLKTLARHMLDEIDPGNSHWDSDRIGFFLNEALVDAALRLPAPLLPKLGTSWAHHLSIGVSSYLFDQEYIRIDNIFVYFRHAEPVDKSFINAFADNIIYLPTEIHPYVTKHGQTLTVYPAPITLVTNGLQVDFTKPPTDMSGDSDVPDLPLFSHRWLVLYAVAKCLQEDDIDKWKGIYEQYLEMFNKFKGAKT